MTDWQPIATAPHGVMVLAWSEHSQTVVTAQVGVGTPGHYMHLTHWTPPPSPPGLTVVCDSAEDFAAIANAITSTIADRATYFPETATGTFEGDVALALYGAGYTTDCDGPALVCEAIEAGPAIAGSNLVTQMVTYLRPYLRRVDPADSLTLDDIAGMRAAVLAGIDNYDGGDIALDISRTLIAAGWTAPECDDDADALRDYVYDAMPDSLQSYNWKATRYAAHTTDNLVHVLIPLEVTA